MQRFGNTISTMLKVMALITEAKNKKINKNKALIK